MEPALARPAGRSLLDWPHLSASELGIDEEFERAALLVLLQQVVQRRVAQPGQRGAGGVAEQARLDDLQGKGMVALADERGSGLCEPLLSGELVLSND